MAVGDSSLPLPPLAFGDCGAAKLAPSASPMAEFGCKDACARPVVACGDAVERALGPVQKIRPLEIQSDHAQPDR